MEYGKEFSQGVISSFSFILRSLGSFSDRKNSPFKGLAQALATYVYRKAINDDGELEAMARRLREAVAKGRKPESLKDVLFGSSVPDLAPLPKSPRILRRNLAAVLSSAPGSVGYPTGVKIGMAASLLAQAYEADLSEEDFSDVELFTTGDEHLDKLFENGFMPGRMVLLYGPSGAGKSLFALQMTANAALDGALTLYIDTEGRFVRLEEYRSSIREVAQFWAKVRGREVREGWMRRAFLLSFRPSSPSAYLQGTGLAVSILLAVASQLAAQPLVAVDSAASLVELKSSREELSERARELREHLLKPLAHVRELDGLALLTTKVYEVPDADQKVEREAAKILREQYAKLYGKEPPQYVTELIARSLRFMPIGGRTLEHEPDWIAKVQPYAPMIGGTGRSVLVVEDTREKAPCAANVLATGAGLVLATLDWKPVNKKVRKILKELGS